MRYLQFQTLTRPNDTTAYASGDLIANSTTASAVAVPALRDRQPAGQAINVSRVLIRKSGTSVTTCDIRVHLFSAPPTTFANGDNGAFSSNGLAGWICSVDVSVTQAFTDGAAGLSALVEQPVLAPSGVSSLWCVLEARSTYTPAANETFDVVLYALDSQ